MIVINYDDKEKVIKKYKQDLEKIKKHYQVNFDVQHLENNSIKLIDFTDLIYTEDLGKVFLSFNNITGKVDYSNYEFYDYDMFKKVSKKKINSELITKYKLHNIINDINRVNKEYRENLAKIT